jgi:hypothetical protein
MLRNALLSCDLAGALVKVRLSTLGVGTLAYDLGFLVRDCRRSSDRGGAAVEAGLVGVRERCAFQPKHCQRQPAKRCRGGRDNCASSVHDRFLPSTDLEGRPASVINNTAKAGTGGQRLVID